MLLLGMLGTPIGLTVSFLVTAVRQQWPLWSARLRTMTVTRRNQKASDD